MDKPPATERFRISWDTNIYLSLFAVFYFFFLLLTPLGTEISFVPHGLEPRGVYNVLKIDAGDDAGYFAYLRSMFIDHDIDFFNEFYYAHRKRVTGTGYVFNQWNIGPAVLWLPFFLLAHGVTKIYNLLGVPLAQNGLSFVYFSSTALGSATYVYLGLVLHFMILRRWFSRRAAFCSVTLFFLATPLLYFTFIRSRMAHADDYFLTCLFVLTWLRFRSAPSARKSILLGLAGGLMILTRINSICFLALPLYDVGARFYRQFRANETVDRTYLRYFFWSLFFCAIVYSVQMSANFILSGTFAADARSSMVLNTIFSPNVLQTLLANPARILWGSNWGLFWHAPVYIVAACGLYGFVRNHKSVGLPLLAALAIPLFLAWVWPHHGISFGQRHLLTTNVIFSFGLAWLFDACRGTRKFQVLVAAAALLIAWNYIQICFYKIVVPYSSPRFVLQVAESLRILLPIPELLLRGDNFFFLIFHPDFQIKTYLDHYLLVLFPLFQLLAPLILLFTGGYIWDRMNRRAAVKKRIAESVIIIMTLFFVALNVTIQIWNDPKSPQFIARRKALVAERPAPEIAPQTRFGDR